MERESHIAASRSSKWKAILPSIFCVLLLAVITFPGTMRIRSSTPSAVSSEVDLSPPPPEVPRNEKSAVDFIGVPAYLSKAFMKRLVDSINYPVNHLAIVVNGREDTELLEYIHLMQRASRNGSINGVISKLMVKYNDENIGVAAAWNQLFDMAMSVNASYCLLIGTDVAFYPSNLIAIAGYASKR
jgi:hypothetical protein